MIGFILGTIGIGLVIIFQLLPEAILTLIDAWKDPKEFEERTGTSKAGLILLTIDGIGCLLGFISIFF